MIQSIQNILSDQTTIAIAILIVVNIILTILVIMMHIKLKRFLVGIDSDSISDSLSFASTNIKDLQKFRAELESYLTTVENRLKKSIQSIKTIRFNPFKGTGGGSNQSFATSFLNEEGDGVIISSLYSRDRVSVFAKPITDKKSEFELSEEEREVIK